MMKIQLDQDRCVAGGQCVMAAEDVFDQRDDDGVAFLLKDEGAAGEEDDVRTAAMLWPAAAIRLLD